MHVEHGSQETLSGEDIRSQALPWRTTIRTRLADIGQWLKINREAIYATKPWSTVQQDKTIRFKQSKNRRCLYAIYKGWPQGTARIEQEVRDDDSKIRMHGVDQDFDMALVWQKDCD